MIKAKLDYLPRGEIVSGDPQRQIMADEIALLTADIKSQGLLEPLLVRPKGDGFEVVVGERRLRACDGAGLTVIACLVAAIGDEGIEAARKEYRTKRQRWTVIFPRVRTAMLQKASVLKKVSPALMQSLAAALDLPKKIKPGEVLPALAAKEIRKQVNAATDSYFAEERIAPWAKSLGVNIKTIERKEKSKEKARHKRR